MRWSCHRYEARVQAEEFRLAERLEAGGSDGEELDEDDLLLARMGAGLYTLQQCCLIIGNLWAAGDVALRKRILMLLHQKGRSLGQLKELLLEHYVSIGDDGEQEEAERLRRK
jgi:beta-catenin-like protein 1